MTSGYVGVTYRPSSSDHNHYRENLLIQLIKKTPIIFFIATLSACTHFNSDPKKDVLGLTTPDRKELFEELVSEMERLDAQALAVRDQTQRPGTWHNTVKSLEDEFTKANSKSEYANILNRLNLAYTNGHAELHLGEVFNTGQSTKSPAVLFQTFWDSENRFKNTVTWVSKSAFKAGEQIPIVGDEVVAINGRPIESWLVENFNFCKFPLKAQCSSIFSDQFLGEKLTWLRTQELTYALTSGSRSYTARIPITEATPPNATPKRARIPTEEKIKREYPGFKLVYTGENAFVYESINQPKVAILRITSFGYWPTSPITTPYEEVEKLGVWWKGDYRKLVIDLTENRGGNDPLPYFRILFNRSVNNVTRVRFKKIREFTEPEFQESLFWGDPQRLVFVNELLKNHWSEFAEGSLLPPEPYVCGRSVGFDCSKKYEPYDHKFKGKISVLISSKCMSSCDEFVLTLKKYFGHRMQLIGQPEFSDTGFSRLRIAVKNRPINGRWTKVLPFNGTLAPEDLFHQEVVVTRSVDEKGKLIDGQPLKLDVFVPDTIDNHKTWYQSALAKAL